MEQEMDNQDAEYECNRPLSDKIEFDGVRGVTYFVTIGNTERLVGSGPVTYEIRSIRSDDPKNHGIRASRERMRGRGAHVPMIDKAALRDELVILPGAAMSADDVVRALQKVIEEVRLNGMYIGWCDATLLVEKLDGTVEEAT